MKLATKFILTLIIASITGNTSSAQIFDKTKGKNVQKLFNQTTNVYVHGPGLYTERIKTAFETHWNITPFIFHDIAKGLPELESGSSVFAPGVVRLTVRDHTTFLNHPFYVFGQGGRSGKINGDGIVAAFPINGFHYEFDVKAENMFNNSALRIPYIVYTLNEMLTHLKANGSENEYFKSIDAKTSRIGTKTLLIPAELLAEYDVNPNTTALMKADLKAGLKPMKPLITTILEQGSITYNGKFKIMSTEDIIKLEQTEEAGKYALFLPAINHNKIVMVFDLKTKEMLYYQTIAMGTNIKEKDFERLNKAIGL